MEFLTFFNPIGFGDIARISALRARSSAKHSTLAHNAKLQAILPNFRISDNLIQRKIQRTKINILEKYQN
jgi:hypothetical protein